MDRRPEEVQDLRQEEGRRSRPTTPAEADGDAGRPTSRSRTPRRRSADGEAAADREGRHPDAADGQRSSPNSRKWDGAEPKLGNEADADAVVAALKGVPLRRHEGRAEGPAGPAAAAVHHQHAAAAGEHPAAVHGRAGRCRRPRSCTKASSSAARARSRSSPTCVPTARASRTTRSTAVRELHPSERTATEVPAREAERLRLRQERPGGPRSDPPDGRDHHAAAGRRRWASAATSSGSTRSSTSGSSPAR